MRTGRAEGLDIQGADVKAGEGIHEIRDDRLPFPDASFDRVLANQVFEHVPSLDASLNEVARVLKPDGLLVALFPTVEVLREAHCGVPFLHWIPKRARVGWASLCHPIGFSFEKGTKSAARWAAEAVEWMDLNVYYRKRSDVLRAFGRRFDVRPAEEHYLSFRWKRWAPLLRIPWVREGGRTLCRRLNGLVLVGRRRI